MKLAIMQPYFFPYIGYFQLLSTVDKFVLLDDVNYINKGWINRNRLLLNGLAHTFTVPLSGASQNKHICEIKLISENDWREKLLKTIQFAYSKAPYYQECFNLSSRIINHPSQELSDFLFNSLQEITIYLGLDSSKIIKTSRIYNNQHLKGQERILDICLQEKASVYVNPIGGMELYKAEDFFNKGVLLQFLKSEPISYPQYNYEHISWLSILDVLMFNSPEMARLLLNKFELITN